MYGIRSEVKAIWGKKESLTNNEISVNTMSVDEEETERIFDAYGIEEAVYILEEDHIDIEIHYPQLHGFKDSKKEDQSINRVRGEEINS